MTSVIAVITHFVLNQKWVGCLSVGGYVNIVLFVPCVVQQDRMRKEKEDVHAFGSLMYDNGKSAEKTFVSF